MPDKKLTDAETVKALEDTLHRIKGAEHLIVPKEGVENLCNGLQTALDLINRLQAELDEYKKIKTTINEFWEILLTLSLFKRKEKPTLEEFAEAIQEIKAEAYKEFAGLAVERVEKAKLKYQRLCKEQGEEMEEHMHIHFNGIIGIISNLLNELVGDK